MNGLSSLVAKPSSGTDGIGYVECRLVVCEEAVVAREQLFSILVASHDRTNLHIFSRGFSSDPIKSLATKSGTEAPGGGDSQAE